MTAKHASCRPKHVHGAEIVVTATGLRCHRPPGRPVAVGERFRNIRWAECSTGISHQHIGHVLSGRIKHARGVVFAYAEDVK
jgi:hypothetical protein